MQLVWAPSYSPTFTANNANLGPGAAADCAVGFRQVVENDWVCYNRTVDAATAVRTKALLGARALAVSQLLPRILQIEV